MRGQVPSRREFLRSSSLAASLAVTSAIARDAYAAHDAAALSRWIASPPAGFEPLSLPGRVVRVTKGGGFGQLMQSNLLWPKPEVASAFLERALTELTGAADLSGALSHFVHRNDRVAIKVNGIAGDHGYTMAFNVELILPLVEGLLGVGIPAENISVFEQFPEFLKGTRLGTTGNSLPHGVVATSHMNRIADMPSVRVFHPLGTRYAKQVTDSTALIDCTLMKDHLLCGFTGALKNMSHGMILNPQDHHRHRCDPQIPLLVNHPIVRSRMRLHLVDAFKIIYDEGPLDKNPKRRIAHGALYASTDPVALDRVGWEVIAGARRENQLPTLEAALRQPSYIHTAAELGLGVADWNRIRMTRVEL
ncbi:MAG: hypothetical protein RJA70_3357 [Pseudomonadota bacterium]|jgi:hypothetical protein